MFDKAINQIRHQFGVHSIADWCDVRPEWILKMDGVGQATLDHIRIYLAMRDVTLADDQTPEFWKQKLSEARIGKTLSYDDLQIPVPFTILIDSMEQQPFGFQDIAADKTETPGDLRKMVATGEIEQSEIKLLVPTRFQALGVGKGDYSIEGWKGHANIERKSMADAHGTILGWGEHRERFERELEILAAMDCAAVVVECSLGQLLSEAPSRGKKSASENRKILHRQVLSWQQSYRVPWIFCDSRRLAEITTFRILQRFWKKKLESKNPVVVLMDQVQMELAEL